MLNVGDLVRVTLRDSSAFNQIIEIVEVLPGRVRLVNRETGTGYIGLDPNSSWYEIVSYG